MAMVVGLCTLELSIPVTHSLKDKRGVIKPLIAQMRKEFNVSVAEVDEHDVWQAARLGVAMVSNDPGHVHGQLENVVHWIERTQPHLYVSNWDIEVL
jgi:uncharacterized protein YlxP (DUF503 family)